MKAKRERKRKRKGMGCQEQMAWQGKKAARSRQVKLLERNDAQAKG